MAFGANTSEPAMVNTEPLHHPTGGYELPDNYFRHYAANI
jgi:hypothetical protein